MVEPAFFSAAGKTIKYSNSKEKGYRNAALIL